MTVLMLPPILQTEEEYNFKNTFYYKMTGPLAQIVTLAAFGNEFLQNGGLTNDFTNENLSFKFCNKINFINFKQSIFFWKRKEVVIADSPIEWFQFLKKEGCKRLRLFFRNSADQSIAKDYKMAGLIGGGGNWLIETVYDDYSDYWVNHWIVTQKDNPQNNIWAVHYTKIKRTHSINLQIDQQQCNDELSEILDKIQKFALFHNLNQWGNQFNSAQDALRSQYPEEYYYNKELIPVNRYSLLSKQILFAAATAWVFGAMGSWNDLGFETKDDNDKYENLTKALYTIVNQSIISAINSY